MKSGSSLKRTVCRAFCAVVLSFAAALTLAFPAYALAEHKTVRIAFPVQEGMSEVDEKGVLSGYNYDYLQELAEYTGWNVEYITFDDMSADESIMEAMTVVMEGKADLIGPILKSEAVEQMFDFPVNNYGVVYTTLCALEKSSMTEVNFTKKSPLRVAVYKIATTRNQEVENYLEQLGVDYTLIECDSSDEQLSKLQSGEADLLSSITLSHFTGTRTVASFSPRPYYLVTTKGNSALLGELDAAIESLDYTQPAIQESLQRKYFGEMSTGYVLSDQEYEYMTALKQIRILCKTNDLPYVTKGSDGQGRGMLISLLNDFASRNQLEIDYTFCDTLGELEQAWATGEYDCMIGIPFSSSYCAENNMIRTEAVTAVDIVLFAQQQTKKPLEESTVAVYSRLCDQINLTNYAQVLTFENPADCYQAVESGQADYGCSDRFLTEYTLFEHDYNFSILSLIGEEQDICISVSRDMDKGFLSALNKFIHTLPDSAKTTYISDGSSHDDVNGLVLFFRTKPIQAGLIVAVILVLLVSAAMFAFYAAKSKQKNLALKKSQAALSDALVQAENASRAKGDFMSRMSHEIRTPLNAVIGYLDIAGDEANVPEKVGRCIDKSKIASRHLLSIINDILDISSIESGRMKIAHEDFNIKQMLDSLSTLFFAQAKAKNIDFRVKLQELDTELLVGDELRVRQILLNLLSNAVKFTPEGGSVILGIRQVGNFDSIEHLEFTVQDTGIGMSEEYRSRMFTPFEQETASTAKNYGGSGLGLSISKNLVNMMGGKISVQSTLGKGTTFTVLLSFDKSEQSKQAMSVPEKFQNMRALVVDDDEDTCTYVKTLLERMGVSSDAVNSGKKALRRVASRKDANHPYDVCIIDWNMKEMDGIETAKEVRKLCGDTVPIIIATAYDYADIMDEAKAAGVDKIVSKPLFQSTLFDLLVSTYGKYKPVQDESHKRIDLSGVKLLLAEDNEMNMEIAVDILRKAGLVITPVTDGEQALKTFEASAPGSFDAILMDIQMPVMDGYTATRKIRESDHPQAKSIPIIAMTANAFTEDVTAALAAGMNDHVAKPISYDRLFRVLGKCVKG